MGWSAYTFLELCMWPTRAKGDTRRFKARETKYKVCFTTCMEPYPSYVSLYRKFMGIYGILNKFILWSMNKPFPIENSASELRLECSQCLTNHAKRLDLTRWIRSPERRCLKSQWNSTKTMIFEKNRIVRRVCPGGFPRKYVPNVNSCPDTWYWSVSRKLSFLEMKVNLVNWKRLFGPTFPNPELIRLPWMSKSWF